jgi:hypothetical protein
VYPHHPYPYPYLLHLLHRAGSSGDVEAATSFTAAALIGAAPALEAQAIASPAARLRKKNVLRMNVLPESSPVGNDNASDVAVRRMFTFQVWQAARAQGRGPLQPSLAAKRHESKINARTAPQTDGYVTPNRGSFETIASGNLTAGSAFRPGVLLPSQAILTTERPSRGAPGPVGAVFGRLTKS